MRCCRRRHFVSIPRYRTPTRLSITVILNYVLRLRLSLLLCFERPSLSIHVDIGSVLAPVPQLLRDINDKHFTTSAYRHSYITHTQTHTHTYTHTNTHTHTYTHTNTYIHTYIRRWNNLLTVKYARMFTDIDSLSRLNYSLITRVYFTFISCSFHTHTYIYIRIYTLLWNMSRCNTHLP